MDQATLQAIGLVAAVGAGAGLIGALLGGRRTAVVASTLMGAIGGITAAAIGRVTGIPVWIEAGAGYSLVLAAAGGLLLALVVGLTRS